MDALTAFGVAAVTSMMVFHAFESRHPHSILAVAGASPASSAYGILAGRWPLGAVELVGAGVAVRRWKVARGRWRC